jgi:hypothetical protein
MKEKNQSKQVGANARAAALTPERRSSIATKAAFKKAGLPSATHTGSIKIGGAQIPCAVLDDGRRVVWQREVVGLLTGNKKGGLSRYLSASNLELYAPDKFKTGVFDDTAIAFEMDCRKAHGFEAEDIVEICRMYMNARRADVLLPSQIHLAAQAEIIVLSLAVVGISALIDEATGYDTVRDKKALQAILDQYLAKELAAWAKRFPDEFYEQMFRLKNWKLNPLSVAKPGVVGRYTIDLIYERLAPGLVEELELLNPKTDSGSRKSKHHQWLSSDIGHPALAQHIHAVMGLMRACSSWDQFLEMLDRSFPKKGHTIPLLLEAST